MLTLWFIRHGQTQGNRERRYIGRTDEPLCPDGIADLLPLRDRLPVLGTVWGSPMVRCRQTAQVLFPQAEYRDEPLLRECDFGMFEGKNHRELEGNTDYQQWMDSQGTLPFPGGEDHAAFVERCCQGFANVVEAQLAEGREEAALVVHGGTIMAVLSRYEESGRPFYDWQVPNGDGYQIVLDPDIWRSHRTLRALSRLSDGEAAQ